jgi:protein-S-isoprenylcysteine O-methyltransferase Ste14
MVGAGFYGAFFYRFVRYYADSGRLIGVLFAAQLAAAALVFLVRRSPKTVSTRPIDWIVAWSASVIAFLVEPASYAWRWQLPIGSWLQGTAVCLWLWALASLGRSFGIVAADRGVKTTGPYRFVRHPIYLSYLLGGMGYLMQSFSLLNVAVIGVGAMLSILRIQIEERHLSTVSERYRQYQGSVRFRLLLGIW